MFQIGAHFSRYGLMLMLLSGLYLTSTAAATAQDADPDFVPLSEFGNETTDLSAANRGKFINFNKKSAPQKDADTRSVTDGSTNPSSDVRSLQEANLNATLREIADSSAPIAPAPTQEAGEPQPRSAPARIEIQPPIKLQAQHKTTYVIAHIPATQLLQADDHLQLDILNQPELSTELVIKPSGHVDLPLFGQLKVAGQSLSQAQKQITDAYANGFFVSPQIKLNYLQPTP